MKVNEPGIVFSALLQSNGVVVDDETGKIETLKAFGVWVDNNVRFLVMIPDVQPYRFGQDTLGFKTWIGHVRELYLDEGRVHISRQVQATINEDAGSVQEAVKKFNQLRGPKITQLVTMV